MSNQKPLCYAPFIGLYADYTGKYAPCCVSKKIDASSLDSFWFGEKIKDIRSKLLDHKWPAECQYCKNKHDSNLKSDIPAWDRAAQKIKNLEIDINNGNQYSSPLILDFRPGNKCNLKCRMCGPKFSSQWQTEIENNHELTKWFSKTGINANALDEFITYSDKLNLMQVKILGGEPTIDESVILFLENMISKKEQLPQLNFTTNGTNLNKRFRNIMNSFEDVHVTFSIDAVGKEFEYIRTNASWKKVQKNIELVFKEDLATIYSFNTILMPYSLFAIKELIQWYVELYQKGYYFSLCVDTSEAPYTSLSAVLPEDIKSVILDLEKYFETVDPQFFTDIEGANDFLDILKSAQFSETDYKMFKDYNNLLDNIRQTSLLLLDERFSKYV